VGKKGIWVIAIAAAFIAGTITTGTVAYAASGGQGDSLIVIAINELTAAVLGIEPTVNVNSEATKNVISFISGINPDLNCPDGSKISGLPAMTFRMDDFGDLPIKKDIRVGSSTLMDLFLYDAIIDGNDFEVTGIGEIGGGPPKCGFAFTPFTFSITGQCIENTQLEMTTSIGLSISTTGSASCLVVSDPGIGIIAPG